VEIEKLYQGETSFGRKLPTQRLEKHLFIISILTKCLTVCGVVFWVSISIKMTNHTEQSWLTVYIVWSIVAIAYVFVGSYFLNRIANLGLNDMVLEKDGKYRIYLYSLVGFLNGVFGFIIFTYLWHKGFDLKTKIAFLALKVGIVCCAITFRLQVYTFFVLVFHPDFAKLIEFLRNL
jgi:hypothetical protein